MHSFGQRGVFEVVAAVVADIVVDAASLQRTQLASLKNIRPTACFSTPAWAEGCAFLTEENDLPACQLSCLRAQSTADERQPSTSLRPCVYVDARVELTRIAESARRHRRSVAT